MNVFNKNFSESDTELSYDEQEALIKMLWSCDDEIVKLAFLIIYSKKKPQICYNISENGMFLPFDDVVRFLATLNLSRNSVNNITSGSQFDKEYLDIFQRLKNY